MKRLIQRYTHWLHTRWPAGTVESLPVVGADGATNVPGVRIAGDLTGVPLLKFSSETAARAVRAILAEPEFRHLKDKAPATPGTGRSPGDATDGESDGRHGAVPDVAIIGAGVAGVSAAIECVRAGLSYVLFEAARPFATVANFPRGKPIYTYPNHMTPSGGIRYGDGDDVKERLLESMRRQAGEHGIRVTEGRIERLSRDRSTGQVVLHHQDGGATRARRAIVAIGRSGDFRKLDIPGEELDKVSNRLHDPADHRGRRVLVVGGGDSALEAAIALTISGADVTLSYRKPEFSRPKPANLEQLQALAGESPPATGGDAAAGPEATADADWLRGDGPPGRLTLAMNTAPVEITADEVKLRDNDGGGTRTIDNDAVFAMIGREPPLDFLRRSGIKVAGDRTPRFWLSLAAMLLLLAFAYQWKQSDTWLPLAEWFSGNNWFPHNLTGWWRSLAPAFSEPSTLPGTMSYVIGDPGFVFSFLYTTIIVVFGIRRIRRRRTPYITRQTVVLTLFQAVPLFLLPYLLLPWAGFNGWYDAGVGKALADEFFPEVDYGSGREYWRAFGLILAWPLFVYNVFTDQPMWGWLAVSLVQTFVIIPLIILRWGKGAYCGWVCSCGALAETLGDAHRHKMPHGPFWNRFNMVGQVFLALAMLLLLLRVLGWIWPGSVFGTMFNLGFYGSPGAFALPWSYTWFVDLLWAGILGFGLYFHFSGRVWCRFACPLAALMHVYTRFTRFRIFAEKSKCISCNVCTSVCHQGIDVMSFANKGRPMEDPQCVRCSACVQQCPTGVLSFGRYSGSGPRRRIVLDRTPASPVRMRETGRADDESAPEE